jgi:uncharacterized membrane protein
MTKISLFVLALAMASLLAVGSASADRSNGKHGGSISGSYHGVLTRFYSGYNRRY